MAYETGILIGWGAYPALLKNVIDSLGTYTCLLFNHIVLVLVIGITAIFTIRLRLPSDFAVAAILIGSIVGAAAVYLYYSAIMEGHVSVVTVLASLQTVWTVVVSYFLFSEKLTIIKYISIAVIFVGAVLASLEKPGLPAKFDQKHILKFLSSGIWSKGAGLALLVSFCWAFYNLASKYGVKEIGPHATMVYMEVLILLFIASAFLAKPAKELVTMPRGRHMKWLAPAAALFSLGAICFYFSMKYSPLSVVVPIIQGAPAVTAVTAVAFAQERIRVHQYAGIVLAVVGIIFLSL
ncbi:DMT family transporter [Candidatus Woesearchaeota archaeon]|nr:DMT family transporter [Candidatus Woesearchaeota archaeon]